MGDLRRIEDVWQEAVSFGWAYIRWREQDTDDLPQKPETLTDEEAEAIRAAGESIAARHAFPSVTICHQTSALA